MMAEQIWSAHGRQPALKPTAMGPNIPAVTCEFLMSRRSSGCRAARPRGERDVQPNPSTAVRTTVVIGYHR
jgi:hypothetical protein